MVKSTQRKLSRKKLSKKKQQQQNGIEQYEEPIQLQILEHEETNEYLFNLQ